MKVSPLARWSPRRDVSFMKLTRESSTAASSTSRPLARWVVDAFHSFRERWYRVAVMGATVVCSRKVMSGKISPLLMPTVTVIFLRLALLSRTRERPFACPSPSEVVALLAAESNSAKDSKSPGAWGAAGGSSVCAEESGVQGLVADGCLAEVTVSWHSSIPAATDDYDDWAVLSSSLAWPAPAETKCVCALAPWLQGRAASTRSFFEP